MSNNSQLVDDFVGKLTFQIQSMNTFCEMTMQGHLWELHEMEVHNANSCPPPTAMCPNGTTGVRREVSTQNSDLSTLNSEL